MGGPDKQKAGMVAAWGRGNEQVQPGPHWSSGPPAGQIIQTLSEEEAGEAEEPYAGECNPTAQRPWLSDVAPGLVGKAQK